MALMKTASPVEPLKSRALRNANQILYFSALVKQVQADAHWKANLYPFGNDASSKRSNMGSLFEIITRLQHLRLLHRKKQLSSLLETIEKACEEEAQEAESADIVLQETRTIGILFEMVTLHEGISDICRLVSNEEALASADTDTIEIVNNLTASHPKRDDNLKEALKLICHILDSYHRSRI